MAFIIADCPHCQAKQMSFAIFGAVAISAVRARQQAHCTASAAAECQGCFRPVALTLKSTKSRSNDSYPDFPKRVAKTTEATSDLETLELKLAQMWPKPAKASMPDHLPASVASAFRQAESNFLMDGHEDAAATMYRRSLDLGLKEAFPQVKGDLKKRIDKLVETHDLPAAIGDWAHEVRLIGNDAAHDLDGLEKADVVAARNFIDAVLRYTFSLPTMVQQRRQASSGGQ